MKSKTKKMSLLRELYDMDQSTAVPGGHEQTPATSSTSGTNPSSSNGKGLDIDKSGGDKTDSVTLDVPLLIKLFEWAREDARSDEEIHKIATNLINRRGDTLTMDDYDDIVGESDHDDDDSYGSDHEDDGDTFNFGSDQGAPGHGDVPGHGQPQ